MDSIVLLHAFEGGWAELDRKDAVRWRDRCLASWRAAPDQASFRVARWTPQRLARVLKANAPDLARVFRRARRSLVMARWLVAFLFGGIVLGSYRASRCVATALDIDLLRRATAQGGLLAEPFESGLGAPCTGCKRRRDAHGASGAFRPTALERAMCEAPWGHDGARDGGFLANQLLIALTPGARPVADVLAWLIAHPQPASHLELAAWADDALQQPLVAQWALRESRDNPTSESWPVPLVGCFRTRVERQALSRQRATQDKCLGPLAATSAVVFFSTAAGALAYVPWRVVRAIWRLLRKRKQ